MPTIRRRSSSLLLGLSTFLYRERDIHSRQFADHGPAHSGPWALCLDELPQGPLECSLYRQERKLQEMTAHILIHPFRPKLPLRISFSGFLLRLLSDSLNLAIGSEICD